MENTLLKQSRAFSEKCCSCGKDFTSDDLVSLSSCGHLLHKLKCQADDFCSICKEKPKTTDAPVPPKPSDTIENPSNPDDAMPSNGTSSEVQKPDIFRTKYPRVLDDEFLKKQFEVQRDITMKLIAKIQILEDAVNKCMVMINETFKILKTLTKAVGGLQREVFKVTDYESSDDEAEDAGCKCPHSHGSHHHHS